MKLALFGGNPVRTEPYPAYPIIGAAEKQAVMNVLDSGNLNGFRASEGPGFLGGPKVREFEDLVASYYDVEYAVSFTSATAALHAACDAVGVREFTEAIVTPYSFNSSATCVLMANGRPIFADVEYDSCCLDPDKVGELIVDERTRAIIPVHLFGGPANMSGLMTLSEEHSIPIIEDCAQAPGAQYSGKLVGTFGDCGILSFVADKHVSTGEGGMLITDIESIAHYTRLIRNHADALYKPMLGWNYRMTEIQAAIGIEQWKKLDEYNRHRIALADYLTQGLSGICGITTPVVRIQDKHVYYAYVLKMNEELLRITQKEFVMALKAEGIPCGPGYIRPLHLLPLFKEKAHLGLQFADGQKYDIGLCPVAERLSFHDLVVFPMVRPPASFNDMEDVVRAIHKVLDGEGPMDIKLEEIEEEHLWQLKKWRNTNDIRLRAREYRLLNMVNQRDWFESMSRDRNTEMFLITVPRKIEVVDILFKQPDRTPIGVCGLCNIDWVNRHAEVSIYIGDKDYQRKGIATMVLSIYLPTVAFLEYNLEKLWAEVYECNKASIALFEKCDYERVGEMKKHVKLGGQAYSSFLYEHHIPESFKYDRDNS